MTTNVKFGLFFLGGVVLGAAGAVVVGRGKLNFRPFVTDVISRGIDAKEAVVAKAETVREDMEDLVAEAKVVSEQRKTVQETAE